MSGRAIKVDLRLMALLLSASGRRETWATAPLSFETPYALGRSSTLVCPIHGSVESVGWTPRTCKEFQSELPTCAFRRGMIPSFCLCQRSPIWRPAGIDNWMVSDLRLLEIQLGSSAGVLEDACAGRWDEIVILPF